jgi:hypothetical protein
VVYFKVFLWNLAAGTEKNNENLRIAGLPNEIQTKLLSNTKLINSPLISNSLSLCHLA